VIAAFIDEARRIETLKNELITSLESMAAISEQSAASTEEINASTEEQLSRVTEIGHAIEILNEDIRKLSEEMGRFTI
jgi:methyl-accepting chemotaxis protein